MRCSECGDAKRLNQDGVCEWRAGCEHRVLKGGAWPLVVQEAERIFDEELLRELGYLLPGEDDL